jgi:arsenate reductase|tara:strand:+ start:110 stop:541 length:432 start_codon:yes stop_codon:yes gene_type:complete
MLKKNGVKMNFLFVCVHNSGRSQMAEAFFNNKIGKSKHFANSAGTEPTSHINLNVIEAMKEKGIDISKSIPKLLTYDMIQSDTKVITMGCSVDKSKCPVLPQGIEDWNLDDPNDKSYDDVKIIRDQVEKNVLNVIKNLNPDEQ